MRTLRSALERLRASEIRLINAQRLARVGSWERELETDRSEWSDEMFRILGMPNDGPAGLSPFLNRVHPEDRQKILKYHEELRSSSAPVDLDYRVIGPDGGMRFLRSVTEMIRNDQGVPVRLVGATQDITEQVIARRFFERAKSASAGYLKKGLWAWRS